MRGTSVELSRGLGAGWALVASALSALPALGQLRPDQVLVVYDSRSADSRAVAEYYAGSAKVPGGVGGLPGVHPGVHVFNLNSAGQSLALPGGCTYPQFIQRVRDPIRAHLLGTGDLATRIRCLVMTKGLPHRIEDTNNGGIGDNPGAWVNEFNAGDATAASMCGELSLLWQDLTAGEQGFGGDSRADGFILNPLWKLTQPATTFNNTFARATNKAWVPFLGTGLAWTTSTAPNITPDRRLLPGDIMLVSTLDGNSVADVIASINRAQNLVLNVDTAAFIFDESGSNGLPDAAPNNELDNLQPVATWLSDDYETSRMRVLNDGRFNPSRVYYNALGGETNFYVGPLINYGAGQGIVVSDPVLVLAHYGNNHAGNKPGGTAGNTYAESFNYAPGAFFCTMESFNCRQFGGLGDLGQEQAADFIGAGGTFAIGNTWEPFANFTPDVEMVVRNFYLGTMTWVEAAYSAIPCLSWQQMVIGDPLARPIRSIEDRDGDGDVDLDDLFLWNRNPVDLNRDSVINGIDLGLIESSVRGADQYTTRP